MILMLGTLLVGWLILHWLFGTSSVGKPILISHRGAAGLGPENTLASVSKALNQGVRWIEVDVRRSKDGVLVLMHDRTVDRTTDGMGSVGELTWERLSELDAGSHFSNEYAEEPVPSLESLLTMTQDGEGKFLIEVKEPDLYPGIAEELNDLLVRYGFCKRVYVISFDRAWLESFKVKIPGVTIGGLYPWIISLPRDSEMDFLDVYWLNVIVDPTLVWRAHRRGYKVIVWTANNELVMKALSGLGVDGITTDRPDQWPTAMEALDSI